MRGVTVKYLSNDSKTGNFTYRRRVPKSLKAMVAKTEFLKVLGNTQGEALTNYGAYHRKIEHMVALAKYGVVGLSPVEQRDRLAALLEEWGADAYSPGRDDNERTWREEAAGQLIDKYQDAKTGRYEGVPADVGAVAGALLGGVSKDTPKATVTDAFKFYLTENGMDVPYQRRKQEQRFTRAECNLLLVLGEDKAVADITRQDARAWRDARVAKGVAPATLKREMSDIRAVINLANSELDAGSDNPFSKLSRKKSGVGRLHERLPLPLETIEGVYDKLSRRTDLLRIWTLLDYTGARPAEIRMLRYTELMMDCPVPHIVIQAHKGRTLKNSWAERRVPLVGEALTVAKAIFSEGEGNDLVFPQYGEAKGVDNLSSALMKRIRFFTTNPKHVAYSLRHNMKDRMRRAEIFSETAKAIEGHAYSDGQDGSYGSPMALEQMQNALRKTLKGYREPTAVGVLDGPL